MTDPIVTLLREVRKNEGWTQEDVAAAIGLSRAQVVNIELGRSDLPLGRLRKWCSALDVGLRVSLDPQRNQASTGRGNQRSVRENEGAHGKTPATARTAPGRGPTFNGGTSNG